MSDDVIGYRGCGECDVSFACWGRPGFCIRAPVQPLTVHQRVCLDIEERARIGLRTYGTPLLPHNGRDALQDAYEEALDLACYLKQVLLERG